MAGTSECAAENFDRWRCLLQRQLLLRTTQTAASIGLFAAQLTSLDGSWHRPTGTIRTSRRGL